jgi:hypothetical protein
VTGLRRASGTQVKKLIATLIRLVAGVRVGQDSRHENPAFPGVIDLGLWRQSSTPYYGAMALVGLGSRNVPVSGSVPISAGVLAVSLAVNALWPIVAIIIALRLPGILPSD